MTTATLTLADFLLARIAEDERRLDAPDFIEDADSVRGPGWGNRGSECPICGAYQFDGLETVTEDAWYEHAETVHQRSRVLVECEAKRRIVRTWQSLAVMSDAGSRERSDELDRALRLLAAPYASHQDYRQEWRP